MYRRGTALETLPHVIVLGALSRGNVRATVATDTMAPPTSEPLLETTADKWNLRGSFATSSAVVTAALLVLLSVFVGYEKGPHTSSTVLQYYMYYIHVVRGRTERQNQSKTEDANESDRERPSA